MSKSPPNRSVSRRDAMRAMGVASAASAAAVVGCKRGYHSPDEEPTSRALAKPYVPGAEAYGTYEERWFPSACGQCPAACGVRVRVVQGRAVRVEGDRNNPLNRGGIGPRGLSSLQGLYDADRITGPLRRHGDKLVPISWDEALEELAAELWKLRTRGRADGLLVWCGHERGLMRGLLARFARVFGTPNFVDGRAGRTGVLAQAMRVLSGVEEVPVFDWEHARMILSLEAGLLEDSCQSVYFTRVAAELRRGEGRRARFVHAGPIFDLCAYNADEWLRVRPGTSGALALGLCNALMKRFPSETALPADLAANVGGPAGFMNLVARFTPKYVETVVGVSPKALHGLADELWHRRPSFVVVDERSLSYSNGFDTAMAAMALNAMLGAFWEPVGGVRAAPVAPFRPWPPPKLDSDAKAGLARPRLDHADKFPHAGSVHETIPESLEALGDARPEIALLYHANPAFARQQPARWRRALEKIPLIVSFSPFRDETVESLADLVLPDHTFLERWDITTPAPALDRALIGLRLPTVAALHDTRSTGDVVVELARRIGGPIADAFKWESYRDAVEFRLKGICDVNRGNLTAKTPRELLAKMGKTGFWIDRRVEKPVPIKVSLSGQYTEPTWSGDADAYPLKLIVFRPHGYAEGSGANLPWLRYLRSRPDSKEWDFSARVHPSSAPGVGRGEQVALESAHGTIRLPVTLDRRMPEQYIAVPMGWGHQALGRWARGYGANVLDLVDATPARETGGAVLSATRVRLIRGAS